MLSARLLDARSTPADWALALDEIKNAKLLGLDCETQDENRHEGLNAYNNEKRHVFDHRRTVMTGFSIYCEGSEIAWYVNLAHADVDNRVTFYDARCLLDAIPDDCITVAHNAPFELVMFAQCHGVVLNNVVCTLQLAVTHHGPDEYDIQKFFKAPITGFHKIAGDCISAFAQFDGQPSGTQREMLGKFIAKESKAQHSYNGFVKTIATGYNLKTLTESKFGVKQMTFKEVLATGNASHMGELTGEQVCAYGADDAYWAVQHYLWMRDDLLANNPAAFVTFMKTENPMVQVYAECWMDGLKLDLEEVYAKRLEERVRMAEELRTLKDLVKQLLPFPEEPNERLIAKQGDWYVGFDKKTKAPKDNWKKKRAQITAWALSANDNDDFAQCFQTSNPIGNSWATERGTKVPASGKLNVIYYQAMRVLLHDLMGHKLIYSDGEVSTDKEARGKIYEQLETAGEDTKLAIMKSLQSMADVEQRMKLFIQPYTQLMDPETGKVYPTLSSMLATRRLAGRNPNGMQLAKGGEAAYIRGFFLPDSTEDVVVSADWSAIELVLIAEMSGDPAFLEVYGQKPYGDLHTGAAADCLAVKTLPGLTEAEFREFKFNRNPNDRDLRDIFTGQPASPKEFFKQARGTPVGKGANFSYWYSGALSTVGSNLGWTSDEMWEAVDRYRTRFAVAEAWRVNIGAQGVDTGFITLPDGHRRVRLEATGIWSKAMMQKFVDISASPAMQSYAELACKRIAGRAKNQLVNAMIQGTCATLAKRSILRLRELIKEAGIDHLVRFMIPIHDELLYSVNREVVHIFIPLLRRAMTEHSSLVSTIPLDCSVAIGLTFQPFNKANPAFSQIELDEAFQIPGVIGEEWEGKKLTDDKVLEVIDFLRSARKAA
jgi:DNA polymerase I-like protein with 3'-5' exonuclease and polymerase domains